MGLQLHLFGPPRLVRNGVAIALNHRKAWALLAYLAITARPHSRDSLATLLWPDYGQAPARGHLRRELARLRELLGEEIFVADREQIALTAITGQESLPVDVNVFQQAVAAAQQCRHAIASPCPACQPHLITADSCYTDHFLAGFTLPDSPAFDDWQFFQREQLSAAQGWVLARLASPPPRLAAVASQARLWVRSQRALRSLLLLPLHTEPFQFKNQLRWWLPVGTDHLSVGQLWGHRILL